MLRVVSDLLHPPNLTLVAGGRWRRAGAPPSPACSWWLMNSLVLPGVAAVPGLPHTVIVGWRPRPWLGPGQLPPLPVLPGPPAIEGVLGLLPLQLAAGGWWPPLVAGGPRWWLVAGGWNFQVLPGVAVVPGLPHAVAAGWRPRPWLALVTFSPPGPPRSSRH